MAPSGVILFPKPAGVSSHDVVARVRRELREAHGERPKVGHAGTLDPFATGLLLVLVGPATRAQRFFMALPKTYRALARLGWRSTTGDPERELDASEAERVSHGVAVAGGVTPRQTGDGVVRGHSSAPRAVRLTCGARVVAIAEPREDRLKPLVVFPA